MIRKLSVCSLLLAVSACATVAPPKKVIVPYAADDSPRSVKEEPISFPANLYVPEDFRVEDATDPKVLVLFALKLESKRKFPEAATFFQEAADLQRGANPASRFRVACLGAAAVCWLKAGDEEHFQAAVEEIRRELDRFQEADLEQRLSVLLAISERLKGRAARVDPSVPQRIKSLFEAPRRMR